jgi:hypothetical protein
MPLSSAEVFLVIGKPLRQRILKRFPGTQAKKASKAMRLIRALVYAALTQPFSRAL